MTDPKTMPQSFGIPPEPSPNPAHASWLARTEQLLVEFEATLPNRDGEPLALGLILLVADHLWERRREQADFARFEVRELVERCGALLRGPVIARNFADTMSAFYDFLARSGRVSPETAAIIEAECRACAQELQACS